jgi:hypothetical protein
MRDIHSFRSDMTVTDPMPTLERVVASGWFALLAVFQSWRRQGKGAALQIATRWISGLVAARAYFTFMA